MQAMRARVATATSTSQKYLQPERFVREKWWKPCAEVHRLNPGKRNVMKMVKFENPGSETPVSHGVIRN